MYVSANAVMSLNDTSGSISESPNIIFDIPDSLQIVYTLHAKIGDFEAKKGLKRGL